MLPAPGQAVQAREKTKGSRQLEDKGREAAVEGCVSSAGFNVEEVENEGGQ